MRGKSDDLIKLMIERQQHDTEIRVKNAKNTIKKYENKLFDDKYIAAKAYYEMATRHRQAWGVDTDYPLSLEYFDKAAKLGYAGACYELGRLYMQGHTLMGIKVDGHKARYYLKIATDKARDNDNGQYDQYAYRQSEKIALCKSLLSVLETITGPPQSKFQP